MKILEASLPMLLVKIEKLTNQGLKGLAEQVLYKWHNFMV